MMGDEGLCCAKCKALLEPERGLWVHRYPERAESFPSYHVPQVICPVHYAVPKNWQSLLYKRDEMAPARFINEVLGESCDEGQRLVSKPELERAACLNQNTLEEATKLIGRYQDIILGVDWGGKGERLQSFTAVSVMGIRPDTNCLEVIYAKVFPALMDPVIETKEVVSLFSGFRASGLAHDVAVAGEVRRSIMTQMGMDPSRLFNCRYAAGQATRNLIDFKPASDVNPVNYYNIDRNRLLAAVCLAVKCGQLKFPNYESLSNKVGKNILDHFLAVYEETTETIGGSEKRFIRRNAGMPDDFLHATGFACSSAWSRHPHTMPRLETTFFDPISEQELYRLDPPKVDYDNLWMD